MSQHDLEIGNQSGAGVRQELVEALKAIESKQSGTAEPLVKRPFMSWAHSANDVLKIRNAANTAWIELYKLSTGEPLQVNLTGVKRLKGDLDASLGQFPSNPESGDTWRISVTGTLPPPVGDVTQSDTIIYSDSGWIHEDHTDQVTSVAGLMGAISATLLLDNLLGSANAATKIRTVLQTVIADLAGVNAATLEGNNWQAVVDLLAGKSDSGHAHDASEITNLPAPGISLGGEQQTNGHFNVASALAEVPGNCVMTRCSGYGSHDGYRYRAHYRAIVW